MLGGCVKYPAEITPVEGFDVSRYLGTWYEIARLDHSFERGLEQVTAEYSMREDGGIEVVNRGYSVENQSWKEAVGKAYFVRSPDIGYLKVSFFGPFYGAYVVFDIDDAGYQYAFVSGPDHSYLWLLSRTPVVDESLKTYFIKRAQAVGYPADEIIFVDQNQ